MDVAKIVQHLRNALPSVQAIYLFGSYVSGDFDAHSDLDIAVWLSAKSDAVEFWRLSGDLADIAGVPVDLVDLGAASTVLQYQILTKGRRLWAKDAFAGLFEAFVFAEKMALDTARAGLLEDVQKDGMIHGR